MSTWQEITIKQTVKTKQKCFVIIQKSVQHSYLKVIQQQVRVLTVRILSKAKT